MDAQHHILALDAARAFAGFGEDLAHHRLRTLDVTGAFAMRARRTQRSLERLLDPLAGDGYQSEIVELQNLVGRAIDAHGFFERLHHLLAILTLVHVDE